MLSLVSGIIFQQCTMKDFANYLNRITQNSGSCARIIDVFRSEITMKNTISDLKRIFFFQI